MCSFLHGSTLSQCLRYSCMALSGKNFRNPRYEVVEKTPPSHSRALGARGPSNRASKWMDTEVNHYGRTAETTVTAALRQTRFYCWDDERISAPIWPSQLTPPTAPRSSVVTHCV